MERRKALGLEPIHDQCALAAQKDDGGGGHQRQRIVVVHKVDRRVVDSRQRLFDDNGMERGRDGRGNAEKDAQLRDVDLCGNTRVESAKHCEAGAEDKV